MYRAITFLSVSHISPTIDSPAPKRALAMHKPLLLLATLGAFLVSGLLPCEAENWPQWRGAKLDGVSHEKGIPLK